MKVSDMFDVTLRLMPGGHDTIVSGNERGYKAARDVLKFSHPFVPTEEGDWTKIKLDFEQPKTFDDVMELGEDIAKRFPTVRVGLIAAEGSVYGVIWRPRSDVYQVWAVKDDEGRVLFVER
jgi:hypothetical protein